MHSVENATTTTTITVKTNGKNETVRTQEEIIELEMYNRKSGFDI